MIKCTKCSFEAKNANGLRLHTQSKHKSKYIDPDELAMGDVYATVGTGELIIEKEPEHARIELLRQDGSLILSYPIHGKKELQDAKDCAKRNNFQIIIKPIV